MNKIEILSFVAAFLTTSCFIPQSITAICSSNTKAISLVSYIFLTFGVFLWMLYGFLTKQNAITIANAITLIFVLLILTKKIYNVVKKID